MQKHTILCAQKKRPGRTYTKLLTCTYIIELKIGIWVEERVETYSLHFIIA